MKQLVFFGLICLTGCVADPIPEPSGNAVYGTIRGQSFSITNAVWFDPNGSGNGVLVDLSTSPISCTSTNPKNSSVFQIGIHDSSGSPGVGTYPAQSGEQKHSAVTLFIFDATCAISGAAGSESGNVVVTSIANGNYVGTFDLIFNTGDHITGKFNAPQSTCSNSPDDGGTACN